MAQQTTPKDDPSLKIVKLFEPMLLASERRVIAELKEFISASSHENLTATSKVEARVENVEKMQLDKKKTVNRTGVTKTDTSTVGVTATGEPPVEGEKFFTNALFYFRHHYKVNEEFRNTYATPDLVEIMATIPHIIQKTNPAQRIVAECAYVWNCMKEKNSPKKEAYDEVLRIYDEYKKAHNEANKPAQQSAEEGTPK